MKASKNIVALFLLALFVIGCKSETQPEVKTVETSVANESAEIVKFDPNATYAKAEFTIEGMTCQVGCANKIEKTLAKMDGVKSAKVDFESKLAMVEFDEAKQNANSLETAVTNVAEVYTVKDMKTSEVDTEKAED